VKWFPSGSVVLTAAMDATIRIFSAENGINPRTLKGHKRAVTSLDILGVGKNVVSGSKDGSIKLWDVSKGVCLTSIYTEGFAGVEKIKTGKSAKIVRDRLSASGSIDGAFEPKHTDGEIQSDTGDTLLFAGLSSSAGNLALYDLASKDPILRTFPHIPLSTSSLPNYPTAAKGGAIHSIAYDADRYLLASGSARGVVVVRDVRMLDKDGSGALHVFRRTEAAINDLAFVPSASSSMIDLVLAPESGLPCRLGIPLDGGEPVSCVEEYAGWEPLSIESVSVGREGQVWVSGAEGGIRRY
jgi:proteasomal ATPase-associated factor 1